MFGEGSAARIPAMQLQRGPPGMAAAHSAGRVGAASCCQGLSPLGLLLPSSPAVLGPMLAGRERSK